MKKFSKLFALLTVLYLAVWFILSGTEAGILTSANRGQAEQRIPDPCVYRIGSQPGSDRPGGDVGLTFCRLSGSGSGDSSID